MSKDEVALLCAEIKGKGRYPVTVELRVESTTVYSSLIRESDSAGLEVVVRDILRTAIRKSATVHVV